MRFTCNKAPTLLFFFVFSDAKSAEIDTLPLRDAFPFLGCRVFHQSRRQSKAALPSRNTPAPHPPRCSRAALQNASGFVCRFRCGGQGPVFEQALPNCALTSSTRFG